MTPKLTGIDHIHVYVADRSKAEAWYQEVLGFRRVDALASWATGSGPLTLEDRESNVHLALFERPRAARASTVAFGATGDGFLAWKAHLEKRGMSLRIADHDVAFSLYFDDPDGNLYEITTGEHDRVRAQLGQDASGDSAPAPGASMT